VEVILVEVAGPLSPSRMDVTVTVMLSREVG